MLSTRSVIYLRQAFPISVWVVGREEGRGLKYKRLKRTPINRTIQTFNTSILQITQKLTGIRENSDRLILLESTATGSHFVRFLPLHCLGPCVTYVETSLQIAVCGFFVIRGRRSLVGKTSVSESYTWPICWEQPASSIRVECQNTAIYDNE